MNSVNRVIELYFKGYSVKQAIKIVRKDMKERKRLDIELMEILKNYKGRRLNENTL